MKGKELASSHISVLSFVQCNLVSAGFQFHKSGQQKVDIFAGTQETSGQNV